MVAHHFTFSDTQNPTRIATRATQMLTAVTAMFFNMPGFIAALPYSGASVAPRTWWRPRAWWEWLRGLWDGADGVIEREERAREAGGTR